MDNQFATRLPEQVRQAVADVNFDMDNLRALVQAAAVNSSMAYAMVPGITSQIIEAAEFAVKKSYIQAFRVVYYTALGFACLAILSALCISDVDPAKKTYEKAVHLENEKVKTVPGGGSMQDALGGKAEV